MECLSRKMQLVILAFALCGAVLADNPRYHGNPREVVFPGPISRSEKFNAPRNNQLVRQIELAKQISKAKSDEEFFKLVKVIPSALSYGVSLTDRFGGSERSKGIKPKPAMCMPELQVVSVKENPDPAAIYFPNCIRIQRCGGCCNHELLSCQPTTTEIRNYEIHVTKLDEELGQYNAFKEIVPLEEHTACECDCKVKEKVRSACG